MTAPQKDDVKDHQQRNERVECGGDDEQEIALLRELWIEDDIEESPIDERHEYAQTDDLDDAKRNALGAIRRIVEHDLDKRHRGDDEDS